MIDFNKYNSISGDLTEEEMLSQLKALRSQADEKYRNLNTMKIVGGNKIREEKIDIINEFFDFLEGNGVDPSDQESLSRFVEEMKTETPEMYEYFEKAIDALLTDSDIQESPVGMPPMMGGEQTEEETIQEEDEDIQLPAGMM